MKRNGARVWMVAYGLVIAAVLAAVGRYYHPAYGFTALIEFPAAGHSYELPAVQNAPHYDHPDSGGYDGQFYAQMAVEPTLRNAAIDRALDDPPYRAHRMLFSWIAYAAGFGRPAAILQAAALENVVVWLVLAGLLWSWIPPESGRAFLLWAGTLLAHGTLMSVRYALPDGLSLLLIALAVLAMECGRPLIAGAVLGLATLARETAILAGVMFIPLVGRPRGWFQMARAGALAVLPCAVWLDYLRSIYRGRTLAGGGHITAPFSGLASEVTSVWRQVSDGFTAALRDDVLALAAFLTQAIWIVWRLTRRRETPAWAIVAAAFLVLALLAHPVVWQGAPGAYTRVAMPLTMGVNVLLARDPRASWWWIVLANLGVVPGVALLLSFGW
ncbi:MAG TPA: glycosyltransferase 87 family protein [Vicinamibacterales bacterium]|nr:glycosyltransferase 87 family protein [Vicinamibacterales bacterium]